MIISQSKKLSIFSYPFCVRVSNAYKQKLNYLHLAVNKFKSLRSDLSRRSSNIDLVTEINRKEHFLQKLFKNNFQIIKIITVLQETTWYRNAMQHAFKNLFDSNITHFFVNINQNCTRCDFIAFRFHT